MSTNYKSYLNIFFLIMFHFLNYFDNWIWGFIEFFLYLWGSINSFFRISYYKFHFTDNYQNQNIFLDSKNVFFNDLWFWVQARSLIWTHLENCSGVIKKCINLAWNFQFQIFRQKKTKFHCLRPFPRGELSINKCKSSRSECASSPRSLVY